MIYHDTNRVYEVNEGERHPIFAVAARIKTMGLYRRVWFLSPYCGRVRNAAELNGLLHARSLEHRKKPNLEYPHVCWYLASSSPFVSSGNKDVGCQNVMLT